MSLQVGQLLDNKYRIVRMIGEGGMGAVFEGENVRINRRVAIKILHAAFAGNAEVMQRFEREAQAAGRIGNDHILEVLDLGTLPDGDRYIIMEFLDGEPLSARIKHRGRLTPHELSPLMSQVLVGLGAAHQAGIIHRDLKPDNLFILREKAGHRDFMKLIDFGISKFQPLSGDGMKMTRTGAVMGTPYYMSPEQASGSAEADARSDIYSLGVIMYEAVTGRVPFDAATFNQLMFKIVLAEVPPPQSVVPELDPAFASIISKAMARDVAHRFQSTAHVQQAIAGWLQSGQAVTLPPAAESAGAGHLPKGARAELASVAEVKPSAAAVAVGQAASSSFVGSQEGAAVSRRSAAPVIAFVLGVGALVLGGSGVVAYWLHVKSATGVTSAAAREPAAPSLGSTHAVPALPSVPSTASVAELPTQPRAGNAPTATATELPAPAVSAVPPPATVSRPPSVSPTVSRPVSHSASRVEKKAAARHEPAPAAPAPKPASGPDFGY